MTREDIKSLGLQPLDLKLRAEVKRHLWFSRFKGSVKSGRDYNNDPTLHASGSPIEVNNKIRSIGYGDRLLIPMEKDLAGAPTLGDAVLMGREEESARAYAKVGYNQVRHAIPVQLGSMDKARERAFRAAEDNLQKLAWWQAQYENYNILTSIYEGASENLYTTTTNPDYGQGLGIPRRYHPNFYRYSTLGFNKIGAAGKFPTALEVYDAAVGTNDNNVDTTKSLDANCVAMARLTAMRKGIKPLVMENGFSFWPWLITPEQAISLVQTNEFKAMAQTQVWKEVKSHPWVNGAIGYFGGFVFFEDVISVRGFSTSDAASTGLNVLGTTELIADSDIKQNPRFLPQEGHLKHLVGTTKANHVSIIFGESFIGEALHENLGFATESQDYNNWQGLGAYTKYGYERLDFVPKSHVQYLEGTEAGIANITNVYNRSSMLIMTHE